MSTLDALATARNLLALSTNTQNAARVRDTLTAHTVAAALVSIAESLATIAPYAGSAETW